MIRSGGQRGERDRLVGDRTSRRSPRARGPRSAPSALAPRAARRSSQAPSPRVAVHSSPEPKSWTKPNTTSPIVGPVGDRDRHREERDAALCVQRAVDRVDDDRIVGATPNSRSPSSSRRGGSRAARWRRSSRRRSRLRCSRRSRSSRRRRRRRRRPAHARSARGQPLRGRRRSSTAPADVEPGLQARAGGRAGRRRAWDRSTCSSAASSRRGRRPRTRPRPRRTARGTRLRRSPSSTARPPRRWGRVRHHVPRRLDDLDVELAGRRPRGASVRPVAVERAAARSRERLEVLSAARSRVVAGLTSSRDSMRREDHQPWVSDVTSTTIMYPLSGVPPRRGTRARLVAVVAVGDQQRRSPKALDRLVLEAPEPAPSTSMSGRARDHERRAPS